MKKITKLFALLLLSLMGLFVLTGCSNLHKPDIEEVITGELDLLKNLDTETTQKYISYKELFPDAAKSTSIPTEVEEVFSLFFQNFDYKILSLDVNENMATAKLRLQTIDAQALAKDFIAARLQQSILTAAQSPDTNDDNNSLEAHYLLLNKILKEKEYGTVETNCTMHLVKDPKSDMWYIQSDHTLENELVGGFISYLCDTNLLSAQDAAEVYFSTIKEMNVEDFSSYLGFEGALDTEDTDEKALGEALITKAHETFDYQIKKSTDNGFTAQVELELTTMDTQQILADYQTNLAEYLATSEAVIDGSEGRSQKSHDLLMEEIQTNDATATAPVTVHLRNDGLSWKLEIGEDLGDTLFGNLTEAEEAEDSSSEESEDTEEDYEET